MYSRHPLSKAFPSYNPERLHALSEDIKQNGLLNPITLYEGEIIDGWHRYTASMMAGLDPKQLPVTDLPEDVDPRAFVMSLNYHRRDMTDAQRAVAVVSVYKWAANGVHDNPDVATNKQMAELADVSERTINRAKAAVIAGDGEAILEGTKKLESGSKPKNPPKPRPEGKVADPRVGDYVKKLEKERDDLKNEVIALSDRINELQHHAESLLEENDSMRKVIETDEHNAVLLKELKQAQELNRVKEGRIASLEAMANEAIKQVKTLQRANNAKPKRSGSTSD
jgi:hypothetical protein